MKELKAFLWRGLFDNSSILSALCLRKLANIQTLVPEKQSSDAAGAIVVFAKTHKYPQVLLL